MNVERAKQIAHSSKDKLVKTDPKVRYQRQPHGSERCGRCTMYREPNRCTAVAGYIDPRGWCKLFERLSGYQAGGSTEPDAPPQNDQQPRYDPVVPEGGEMAGLSSAPGYEKIGPGLQKIGSAYARRARETAGEVAGLVATPHDILAAEYPQAGKEWTEQQQARLNELQSPERAAGLAQLMTGIPGGAGGLGAGARLAAKGAAEAGTAIKAEQGLGMFKKVTGRELGSAPTDLALEGRGDMQLPPGVTPQNFSKTVNRMINDVKQWNTPERRYWYERSGRDAILSSVGNDPEMADRLTAGIAKTSQGTGVLENAAYAARGHHQAMAGEPVSTGMYPNVMGKAVEGYYHEPQVGVVGRKITGYQSGFRSAWDPEVLNRGANDRHNMRWLGWQGFGLGKGSEDATPNLAQHNYDKMVRSAVTDRLNAEGYDNGKWVPGQVQAVGWAKQRAATGTPEAQAGYDLVQAFKDRAAQLTYESAPGKTTNHLPEFHNAPFAARQAYHDAINQVLQDPQGRDKIASHLGLLTLPTKPGLGVYKGAVSPGSRAQVVTGSGVGGWKAGMDPATRELLDASEITRGLLLRQDAVAGHFPMFRNLAAKDANLLDVNTGVPMTVKEANDVAASLAKHTGSDFFSPIYTENGYRILNNPEVSGVGNAELQKALDKTISEVYADHVNPVVTRGFSDTLYHDEDWSKTNGQGYLAKLRALRPDVQRRVSELLATLGPAISQVEETFAKRYGWTPDPATRVWERNPAYKARQAETAQIPVGKPPRPWEQQTRPFYPEMMQRRGGAVSDAEKAKRIARETGVSNA